MELIHKRPVAAVAAAKTADIDIVLCAGGKTREDDRVGEDIVDAGASAGSKADRTILYFVFCSDSGSPCDGGIGLGDVVGSDIKHTRTIRNVFEEDIVEVGVPCAGRTIGTDSHIAAVAGIGGKGHLEELPFCGVGHIDGIHVLEGSDILGVSHHTHVEDGAVAGAGGTCPEG